MSARDDPDPDAGLSAADRAWIRWMCEVAEEYPGVEFERDRWGRFTAHTDDDDWGPASSPAALKALIGYPKPRKATP